MPPSPMPTTLRSVVVLVIAVAMVLEAGVVGLAYARETWWLRTGWRLTKVVRSYGMAHTRWDFRHDGIVRPPTVAAAEAHLADEEPVLGVVAGGQARAYRIAAMKAREWHVVNDLFGDVPVTVTYCDISDCARAFRGQTSDAPLAIRVAGVMDGELLIEADGVDYLQRTGAPAEPGNGRPPWPYEPHELARTSWGEWRSRHPRTDVYIWPTSEVTAPARQVVVP